MNFDDIQVGDVFRVKTIDELKEFYKDKEESFDEYEGTLDSPGFTTDMIKLCGSEVVVNYKFTVALVTGASRNIVRARNIASDISWAWRLEWLVPVKAIANDIDIEKVNDLI